MDLIDAILLGILQGLTEFLPISSSGHLEVMNRLFRIHIQDVFLFSVIVHLGTALSIIVVFWKYISEILASFARLRWDDASKFGLMIIISNIPLGIAGLFSREYIMELFDQDIQLVGLMFIINGFFLFTASFAKIKKKKNVNFFNAIVIGLVQLWALTPGISRSGATLSAALVFGIKKRQGTVFSFLMIAGPIVASGFIEIYRYLSSPLKVGQTSLEALGASFTAAFLVGIIACRFMIKVVEKGKLSYFAYYCFAFGIFTLLYFNL